MKRKLLIALYWFLTLTWGSLMSIVSLVMFLVELLMKKKPFIFNGEIGFDNDSDYGFNLGWCFTSCCTSLLLHESGHGIQNAIYGPFAIFLVYIPSVVRYWYYKLVLKNKWSTYNDAWFEKQATEWGTKWATLVK